MEEVQQEMRNARKALLAKADARALEHLSKKPQLVIDNQLAPSAPDATGVKSGGGSAGLARVVGSGKRGKKAKKAMEECDECEDSDEEMSGAGKQGRMLREHIEKIHGGAFLSKFLKGLSGDMRRDAPSLIQHKTVGQSVEGSGFISDLGIPIVSNLAGIFGLGKGEKKMKGCGLRGKQIQGGEVGVLPPPDITYGNPPQAPASFERNTVGMGKKVCMPKKKYVKEHQKLIGMLNEGSKKMASEANEQAMEMKQRGMGRAGAGGYSGAGASDARKRRGQAVSRLMKEKGMSLGEASKYIKEHGY